MYSGMSLLCNMRRYLQGYGSHTGDCYMLLTVIEVKYSELYICCTRSCTLGVLVAVHLLYSELYTWCTRGCTLSVLGAVRQVYSEQYIKCTRCST
jgi:hypothetical protein